MSQDTFDKYREAYTGLVRAVDDVVVHRPGSLRGRADGDVLLRSELQQICTSTIGLSA
jgi:hypothetical protein